MSLDITITKLAGMGDGAGPLPDGRMVFVPFTCEGDRVRVELDGQHTNPPRGKLLEVLTPSPARIPAACSHFATCGGCQLQHVDAATYQTFKRGRLIDVIRQLRLDEALVAPLVSVPHHSRRRVEFSVSASKDGALALGFSEARSHRTVDVTQCPVLLPELEALLAPLRDMLHSLKKPGAVDRIHATVADGSMVDVVVQMKTTINPADKAALKQATLPKVQRMSLQTEGKVEPLFQHQPITLTIGQIPVELPAGTFLQATAESQQAMSTLVLEHTATAQKVMDLYAGCGTYSLPLLAAGKTVHAVEGSQDMVAALYNAGRKLAGERAHASVRDLYRDPVKPEELNRYDAVVINPPRNGALPQSEALTKSSVRRVVMVSCNPATFLRDAEALIKGGFRLEIATPIDQFLWSHHLELVAAFVR